MKRSVNGVRKAEAGSKLCHRVVDTAGADNVADWEADAFHTAQRRGVVGFHRGVDLAIPAQTEVQAQLAVHAIAVLHEGGDLLDVVFGDQIADLASVGNVGIVETIGAVGAVAGGQSQHRQRYPVHIELAILVEAEGLARGQVAEIEARLDGVFIAGHRDGIHELPAVIVLRRGQEVASAEGTTFCSTTVGVSELAIRGRIS